jgi:hypothetical protein
VPNPETVIREALLQPVPCPNCEKTVACRCLVGRALRVEAQARVVADALVQAGMLPDPQQPDAPTDADLEQVARFLAQESRFVRYYDQNDPADDGWKALLTSEYDVETAYDKAKKANEGGAKEILEGLSRARSVLLDQIRQRRAAKAGE